MNEANEQKIPAEEKREVQENPKLIGLRYELGESPNEMLPKMEMNEFLELEQNNRLYYLTGNTEVAEGKNLTVDFGGNKTLEREITAGHILPPEVRKITIQDERQGTLTGERQGLQGEFFTENGQRLKIYSNTNVTIDSVATTEDIELKKSEITEKIGMFTKEIGDESENTKSVAEVAIARGIDPKLFHYLQDTEGGFEELLNDYNSEYKNLSPQQKLEMAATIIGRLEGQFASRYPDINARESIGKFSPEFIAFCNFNLKTDTDDEMIRKVFAGKDDETDRAKSFQERLNKNIDDRGSVEITDKRIYLEHLQNSTQISDRIKEGINTYGDMIFEEVKKYPNLAQRIPYIFAQIEQESGWNSGASNTNGENSHGLMQINLVANTGHLEQSKKMGLDVANNPTDNIKYGIWYLNNCIERQGSYINGLDLYNGGGNFNKNPKNRYSAHIFGRVEKYLPSNHQAN